MLKGLPLTSTSKGASKEPEELSLPSTEELVKWPLCPGDCRQYRKAVRWCSHDGNTEPGTILQTLWAQSWLGRRQRIKVEIFVAGDAWEGVGQEERSFEETTPPTPYPQQYNDVLVSVGASVQPGTYLAQGPNGAIRIRVIPRTA